MSEIAKLYNDVMAGVEAEKTASVHEDGPDFDRNFFEKVASGDEESTAVLNQFIDEARAEGHSDEEIEQAIDEALQYAGVEDDGAEDWSEEDQQKAAAYEEGAVQAVEDVLNSPLAKQAGITEDDLIEYDLGGYYGAGYAETRAELDEMVEKIAMAKEAGPVWEGAKLTGKAVLDAARRGGGHVAGAARKAGSKAMEGARYVGRGYKDVGTRAYQGAKHTGRAAYESAKHVGRGAMTGPGAAALGTTALAGGGAAYAYKKRKKKK